MTLHLPTHPAGYADHHILRNALLVIGAVVLAVILLVGLALMWPSSTPTTAERTEMERMIDFRAGERAEFAAPVLTDQERINEFRAGERAGEWETVVP
jgi:hypothetical protein